MVVLSWAPLFRAEAGSLDGEEGQLDEESKISRGGLALRTAGGLTRRARQPVDGELSGRSSQRGQARLARAKGEACACR